MISDIDPWLVTAIGANEAVLLSHQINHGICFYVSIFRRQEFPGMIGLEAGLATIGITQQQLMRR